MEGRGIPEGMPDLEFLVFFTLLWTMLMVDEERSEVEVQEVK